MPSRSWLGDLMDWFRSVVPEYESSGHGDFPGETTDFGPDLSELSKAQRLQEDFRGHPAANWIINGNWQPQLSSNVMSIRYLYYDNDLFVNFLSGGRYVYHEVPPEIAAAMYVTTSPGRFVWRVLRDIYPYEVLQRGVRTRTDPTKWRKDKDPKLEMEFPMIGMTGRSRKAAEMRAFGGVKKVRAALELEARNRSKGAHRPRSIFQKVKAFLS